MVIFNPHFVIKKNQRPKVLCHFRGFIFFVQL